MLDGSDVGVRVGAFGCEDLVDEADEGGLLSHCSFGDGEFLPVVWIEVDVTPAVGPEEVAGGFRFHHDEEAVERSFFHSTTPAAFSAKRLKV